MKARQANAAAPVNKHRAVDATRRDAISAFEHALAKGADDVWNDITHDKAVRAVIDAHKKRIRGKEGAEVLRLRELSEVARGELAVLAEAVGKANGALKAIGKR